MRIQHARQMGVEISSGRFRAALAAIASILCPVILCAALCPAAFAATSDTAPAANAFPAALAQIVYPLDQATVGAPATDDFRFTFFGNAFFINEDGYLLTAAHVVSSFRDGGQAYVLAGAPDGTRELLKATVVAADYEHDVALLRATPNPFHGASGVAYLTLSAETPGKGKGVLADSLMVADVDHAHSAEAPLEDYSRGEVLDYQFHQENGSPDSELMLFSQTIVPGQSGSPLVSADSNGVVGVIVGRWLRPTVIPSAAKGSNLALAPGAALRIHYAINLLRANGIAWHAAAATPVAALQAPAQQEAQQAAGFTPPTPLSVVGAPYPPQALVGGAVLLDAQIDADGNLTDLDVVAGDSPFVDVAIAAVRTWTFQPARMDGRDVAGRIGIVFQFPQSFLPPITSTERDYTGPAEDASDRAALPVHTIEPEYPVNTVAQGSVATYNLIDADGQLTSTTVLRNLDALTEPTIAAMHDWEFAPAIRGGMPTDSALVVVENFRRPTLRPR